MIEGGPQRPHEIDPTVAEKLPEQLRPVGRYLLRVLEEVRDDLRGEEATPSDATLTKRQHEEITESTVTHLRNQVIELARMLRELRDGEYAATTAFLEERLEEYQDIRDRIATDAPLYQDDPQSRQGVEAMEHEYAEECERIEECLTILRRQQRH